MFSRKQGQQDISAYLSTRVFDGGRSMPPDAAARHKARIRKLLASGKVKIKAKRELQPA
jgi:hypothetical protein